MPAQDVPTWLQASEHRRRGEFVLVVHPQAADADNADAIDANSLRTLDLLLAELPLKTAVRLCAEITGQPRNALYDAALARRDAQKSPDRESPEPRSRL